MYKNVAFGCTMVLGSTSLAVANISADFKHQVCNHAMYVTKNNI